jgi:hypothetical protein
MYMEKDFVLKTWAPTSQEINEALLGALFSVQSLFG